MAKAIENIIEKGNKIIASLVLALSLILIIIQFSLTYAPFQMHFNNILNVEGERISDFDSSLAYQEGIMNANKEYIDISLLTSHIFSLPKASILINGKKTKSLTNLENRIYVEDGDRVTIDTSPYSLDLSFQFSSSLGIDIPSKMTIDANGHNSFTVTNAK